MARCVSSATRIFVLHREIVNSHLFHLRSRLLVARCLFIRSRWHVTAPLQAGVDEFPLLRQILLEFLHLDLSGLNNLLVACKFSFCLRLLLRQFEIKFLLILLQVIDFLLQDFDVELQLLLDLDVVAHFGLVLLELLLVLLRWKVYGLESRREF